MGDSLLQSPPIGRLLGLNYNITGYDNQRREVTGWLYWVPEYYIRLLMCNKSNYSNLTTVMLYQQTSNAPRGTQTS